jgi:hypothetical protein
MSPVLSRRMVLVLPWLLAFAAPTAAATNHGPEAVGAYGDPERLVVHGCQSFDVEEVKRELLSAPEVRIAGHPLAPLGEYPGALKKALLNGYLHGGFHGARVAAELDRPRQRVVLTVVEGPCYRAGQVRVQGAAVLDVAAFLDRLTKPYPPDDAVVAGLVDRAGRSEPVWVDRDGDPVEMETPLWRPGQPAADDEPSRKRLHDRVRRAFSDLGYRDARFRLVLAPADKPHTVDLVVEVEGEGPPAIVRRIEIAGNDKNSAEDIQRYLGLKPGMLFTREEEGYIAYRLWRSARFVKHRLTAQSLFDGLWLSLHVTEYPPAPPLTQPLSEVESVLLKCRDWLAREDWSGCDMEVSLDLSGGHSALPSQAAERLQGDGGHRSAPASPAASAAADQQFPLVHRLLYSPRRGGLWEAWRDDSQRRGGVADFAVLWTAESVGFHALQDATKFVIRPGDGQITLLLGEKLNEGSRDGKRFVVQIGLSLTENEANIPVRLELKSSPVDYLALAHEYDPQCTIKNGVLTLKASKHELHIEAKSGRLLERAVFTDDAGTRRPFYRLGFHTGGFDQCARALTAAAQGHPNTYDAARPLSSLLIALSKERLVLPLAAGGEIVGCKLPSLNARSLQVWRKLLKAGALQPVDDWLAGLLKRPAPGPATPDRFSVPSDPAEVAGRANPIWAGIGNVAMMVADGLSPRETWPWILAQQTQFVLNGCSQYLAADAARLYDAHETGPLCCLTAAFLMQCVDGEAAQRFAGRGSERLDAAHFLSDCRVLLAADKPLGQCLAAATRALGELDDDELAVVGGWFANEPRLFVECVRTLKKEGGKELARSLPDVLDRLWEIGLRERTAAALQQLQAVKR